MAHQQLAADVHPDELCPPNKSIAASSSVPWIYMAQFWHTLKEDGSKYRLTFMLDRKELSLTLDDFRTIFHLPQATGNNHDSFVPPPSFYDMIPFYKNHLGFLIQDSRRLSLDDVLMKNIFNLGKYKDKVGMKIPDWMITKPMKKIEHYRMYAEVFRIDVPLIQSPPTESTQGTHRTPNAPRSPTPKVDASAPTRSTMIRLRLPQRRSTHLTPPAPVLIVDKADELILQDTLQTMEGKENVVDDSSILRNDEHNIPDTRLEPRSEKKSLKVGITDVIVPMNVYDEEEDEDEITDEVYELKRREKGKNVEEFRITPFPTPIRSPRIHTDLVSSDTEELQELTETHTTPSSSSPSTKFMPQKSFGTLANHLHDAMTESLPAMVDKHVKEQVEQQGKKSAKWHKTSEYETYVSGESSSGHDNEWEQGPSTSVSQDIMEEVSLNVDEAKLKKIAHEMLRQRCTLGDEHQYHIDQMKNFLKSDIVWESRKEILVSPHPRKTTPLVLSFVFNDDDIKERTSRWVNKSVKKLIIMLDMNLNKNDIEDMYLLIMNGKVPDYAEIGLLWSLSVFIRSSVIWERVHDFQLGIESYQQKVNLTAPTISFLEIKKHEMFYIIYEPVHEFIYKNSKKEKRVMRHSEIHKFCDATLNIVLEGLKSYNNDVRYGYNQRDLTKDEVEYLKLFEEEIEDRLKYRRRMRRWESYVNGRPLGLRRERPE
nr:hypothetical protein [Tanacetum cinerariifolium]